jgi:AcrR family transcriptional regulator
MWRLNSPYASTPIYNDNGLDDASATIRKYTDTLSVCQKVIPDTSSDSRYRGLMPPSTSTPKPLRVDAQRNRDALLATARAVFARLGTDVPLEVVAQEAGVGRGTMYRHFPSREHMLAAIMLDNATALEEKARELLTAPELSDGLSEWLSLYDRFATEYPGMSAHVGRLADDESPVANTCGPMRDGFARLWDRAQREGRARHDVTALQALALITSLPKDPATGQTAQPYLDIALEGLRVHAEDRSTAGPGAADRPGT